MKLIDTNTPVLPRQHGKSPAIYSNVLGSSQKVQHEKNGCEVRNIHTSFLHYRLDSEWKDHHEESNKILCRYQPGFPASEPFHVKRINQRCPEEFDAEGPVDEAEHGLLGVRHFSALQQHGYAASQTKRDPLKNVEEDEQNNVAQVSLQLLSLVLWVFLVPEPFLIYAGWPRHVRERLWLHVSVLHWNNGHPTLAGLALAVVLVCHAGSRSVTD